MSNFVNELMTQGWDKYYEEMTIEDAIKDDENYCDPDETGCTKDIVRQLENRGFGRSVTTLVCKEHLFDAMTENMNYYRRLFVLDTGKVVKPVFTALHCSYKITGEECTFKQVDDLFNKYLGIS